MFAALAVAGAWVLWGLYGLGQRPVALVYPDLPGVHAELIQALAAVRPGDWLLGDARPVALGREVWADMGPGAAAAGRATAAIAQRVETVTGGAAVTVLACMPGAVLADNGPGLQVFIDIYPLAMPYDCAAGLDYRFEGEAVVDGLEDLVAFVAVAAGMRAARIGLVHLLALLLLASLLGFALTAALTRRWRTSPTARVRALAPRRWAQPEGALVALTLPVAAWALYLYAGGMVRAFEVAPQLGLTADQFFVALLGLPVAALLLGWRHGRGLLR